MSVSPINAERTTVKFSEYVLVHGFRITNLTVSRQQPAKIVPKILTEMLSTSNTQALTQGLSSLLSVLSNISSHEVRLLTEKTPPS